MIVWQAERLQSSSNCESILTRPLPAHLFACDGIRIERLFCAQGRYVMVFCSGRRRLLQYGATLSERIREHKVEKIRRLRFVWLTSDMSKARYVGFHLAARARQKAFDVSRSARAATAGTILSMMAVDGHPTPDGRCRASTMPRRRGAGQGR